MLNLTISLKKFTDTYHWTYMLFTNATQKVTEIGGIDPGLSGHSLIYCVLKSGVPRVPPKTVWQQTIVHYEHSWLVDIWNKLFLHVASSHVPIKSRKVRGSPHFKRKMQKVTNVAITGCDAHRWEGTHEIITRLKFPVLASFYNTVWLLYRSSQAKYIVDTWEFTIFVLPHQTTN